MAGVTKVEEAPETTEAPENSNQLVVLTGLFVARTGKDNQTTKRYRRGQAFTPVDGVHDVDALVASKVLGYRGTKGLKPSTALDMAQAAAEYSGEEGPVLDLTSQPFEQAPVDSGNDAE